MHPDLGIRRKEWLGVGKYPDELARHDDVLGTDDVDTMGKRGPDEFRIEQGNYAADTRNSEPNGHVLWTIWH